MPEGFGGGAIKTMGRPISGMAHLRERIIEIRTTHNCLIHALIIAIARIEHDSNYESYREDWKIRPVVRDLLQKTGIDLTSGSGIPVLTIYKEHFRKYKILVYQGLSWENMMFEGRVVSVKRLNLLYYDIERHYM